MPWTDNESEPLSPAELKIILECYALPEKPNGRLAIDLIATGHSRGIFERITNEAPFGPNERDFKLTERGEKWVEMILATPMPVARWIDPRGERKA